VIKQAEGLENLTVCPNAEGLTLSSVDRSGAAVTMHWEFDTAWARKEYVRWITEGLQAKFEITRDTDSRLAFARYLDGETESIEVTIVPKADKLHVNVGLSIYPD